MNYNINYYGILELDRNATKLEIKKSYYRLSKKFHPDKKIELETDKFNSISEAYDILINDTKLEYDIKSKWGKSYDESTELLNYEFDNPSAGWDEEKLKDFKKKERLNVVCRIDDSFDGSIEYERWVICKKCKGTGKDDKSKIEIKDEKGNRIKIFDSDGGCDFCEGTGKGYNDDPCTFCFGQGKVGSHPCKSCNGEKRILGKQKLSGILFPKDAKDHKIEFMGNFSKDAPGKVGHLWLVKI